MGKGLLLIKQRGKIDHTIHNAQNINYSRLLSFRKLRSCWLNNYIFRKYRMCTGNVFHAVDRPTMHFNIEISSINLSVHVRVCTTRLSCDLQCPAWTDTVEPTCSFVTKM